MVHRHKRHVRLVVLSLVALGAAALAPSVAVATPGRTPTSAADVQKKLDALMRQNSQLVDKFNAATVDLKQKQKDADAAKQAASAAATAFEQAREAVSETAYAQYTGGAFSAAGALLTSDSGTGYLEQLNTLSMISDHNANVARQLDASKAAADTATKKANDLVKAATQRRDALTKQKADLDKQFATYSQLLQRLTAQQRVAYQRTVAAPVTAAEVSLIKDSVALTAAPAAAQKAVDFALAQIGKPYVYGAAGPDSYDCSGLTMAAYASAGISLPHNAAAQYDIGHHVSLNQLQPGDLIFYYSPIGHVVIYIGGGKAVSASTEGVPIGTIDVNGWESGNITGATRIVG